MSGVMIRSALLKYLLLADDEVFVGKVVPKGLRVEGLSLVSLLHSQILEQGQY